MDPSFWEVDLGHGLGPLVLGTERDTVIVRLEEAKINVEPDDDDPAWLYVPEMEAELTFSRDEPRRLVQIVVEDERLHFGTLPVLGKRVHEIVELLNVPEAETLWRPGEDPALSLPDRDEQPLEPASDEELLDAGTLWITTLGLGLGLWHGEIIAVYLRQPHNSPRRGIGQFLPRHAELSRSPDLRQRLTKPVLRAAGPPNWFGRLAGLAFVAAVAILIWRAVAYQQQWNSAPRVEGQIVAVKPPPPDPFPTEFTVAYQDQTGQPHQIVFDLPNVNDARHIGDKVDLCYLRDDPRQAMGFAASRDAAIEKFLPWGIGIIVAFIAVLFVSAIWDLVKRKR